MSKKNLSITKNIQYQWGKEEMDLAEKVTQEVGKVIGDMAIFFVKKQCKDLGIDIENMNHQDLPLLADRLERAVRNFTSEDVALQLRRGILEIPNT